MRLKFARFLGFKKAPVIANIAAILRTNTPPLRTRPRLPLQLSRREKFFMAVPKLAQICC